MKNLSEILFPSSIQDKERLISIELANIAAINTAFMRRNIKWGLTIWLEAEIKSSLFKVVRQYYKEDVIDGIITEWKVKVYPGLNIDIPIHLENAYRKVI